MNLKVLRSCKGWRERVWQDRVSRLETHPRGMTVNSHPQAFSLKD